MGATARAGAAAAVVATLLLTTATRPVHGQNTTATTTQGPKTPLFMKAAPKLDRAHKNKLLLEAPCGENCKYVFWQIKVADEGAWRTADAEAHSNFPDTFYVRGLRPDTPYVLRALLKPGPGRGSEPYAGDDVPTLEARTCPDSPPPVVNLRAHSAGPGWLEVRWEPPAKERCKSHLFYQARYAPHGTYFSAWRPYGFYRNDRWVHFRPTHPCDVWPDAFCLLVTDAVKAGERHVVEVRVSRFDELTPSVSVSRSVVVRADTACVANDTCGVIGAAPDVAAPGSTPAPAAPNATDEVDVDDADITTTPPFSTTQADDEAVTKTPAGDGGEAAERRARGGPAGGETMLGRAGAVFLALLLLVSAALPAVYFWGKRRGAREAVDLHEAPAWRRRHMGDGGSQPVLAEEGGDGEEERDGEEAGSGGRALQVDHHGRYSWAKLLPNDE